MSQKKRLLVIGGGTAGLCAAKTAIENNFEVTVYEQTPLLGGLWNYTDQTGEDEHGVPFGYMYRDLRTNVPKEIMRFTDFDVNNVQDRSYLTADEVLQFLHSYADEFDIRKVIKFQHQVIRVLPMKEEKWEVIIKQLENGSFFTEIFDYVLVCNGHHFVPLWPEIKGRDTFRGLQKHSFDFRSKEEFQGRLI